MRMTRRRPQRFPGRAGARSRDDGWARRDDIERELAAEAREISESDITRFATSRERAMKNLQIPQSDELDHSRVSDWPMSTSNLDTAFDQPYHSPNRQVF
jgi:hypothetical protein